MPQPRTTTMIASLGQDLVRRARERLPTHRELAARPGRPFARTSALASTCGGCIFSDDDQTLVR